jgi:hypothetical protein
MFDVTKDVSLFAVHSPSLFPTHGQNIRRAAAAGIRKSYKGVKVDCSAARSAAP